MGTEGNAGQSRTHRTQCPESVSQGLERVRQAARLRKKERFTALMHHVTVERLWAGFDALKQRSAPGIDGVTWHDYEANLIPNLRALHARLHDGRYKAQPVRRRYIPKPDGSRFVRWA